MLCGNRPIYNYRHNLEVILLPDLFWWQAIIGLVGPFVSVEPNAVSGIDLYFPVSTKLVLTQPEVDPTTDTVNQHL